MKSIVTVKINSMRKVFSVVIVIVLLGCGKGDSKKSEQTTNLKDEKTMELSQKDKAVAVLESLETGAHEPIAYINPEKYIQHNLAVGDGLEGFGAVMKNAPEGGFKAKVVRAFEDNDYVFTHTIYDFFGPCLLYTSDAADD